MKHTPGPWHLDGEFDAENSVGVRSEDDNLIFELEPFCDDEWHESEIANARLISAAPELLAALKGLDLPCRFDVLNPCWHNRPSDIAGLHWGSEPGKPVLACPNCIARAAIAAAEGTGAAQDARPTGGSKV